MEVATAIIIPLSTALAKRIGAALLRVKYGHYSLYKQAFDEQEVELSQVSILKIVEGVRAVIGSDMKAVLQDTFINQAEIRLGQITGYFANIYPNLGGTDTQKDSQISQYEERLLLDVLGPLSGSNLSSSAKLVCLPAFMVAACVHMAILQERANLGDHMPNATTRHDTLSQYAWKYAKYAEDTFTQGRTERLSKIKEFEVPRKKMLGFKTGDQLSGISDHGLGGFAQTSVVCPPSPSYFQTSKRWFELYIETVDRQLELAVSRHAMLKTFEVWRSYPQYPASIQFTPLPTKQGSSSHPGVDSFVCFSAIHFPLSPQGISKVSDQTFGFKTMGSPAISPVLHQCRDGALQFSPFILPCGEHIGKELLLLCWLKDQSEWKTLYYTRTTSGITGASSDLSLSFYSFSSIDNQVKTKVQECGLPEKATTIKCHRTVLP